MMFNGGGATRVTQQRSAEDEVDLLRQLLKHPPPAMTASTAEFVSGLVNFWDDRGYLSAKQWACVLEMNDRVWRATYD